MLHKGKCWLKSTKKKKKIADDDKTYGEITRKGNESAGIMKRGPIVKRDNYQVTELTFLLPHLLFKNLEFCPKTTVFFIT